MTAFLIAMLVSMALWSGFCLYMLRRNRQVGDLRRAMLNKIFQHFDYDWRIKEYEKVSYDRMMYEFWKPVKLEAFYPDHSFLDGAPTKPVLSPYQISH